MIGTPLAQHALRLQYTLVRVPFGALESQLARAFSEESPVRLTVERGLARCDAVAGRLLGAPDLIRRGERMDEHVSAVATSVDRAAAAEQLRAKAAQVKQDAAEEADRVREEAAQQQRDRVKQAAREKKEATVRAAEQAQTEAAQKKEQAAQRANKRRQEASAARAAEQQRIAERTKRATAPAKATLKSAAEKKSDAADQRAKAGKLAELADTEKTARQSES